MSVETGVIVVVIVIGVIVACTSDSWCRGCSEVVNHVVEHDTTAEDLKISTEQWLSW